MKPMPPTTSGQAITLSASGTATAVSSVRHCRLSSGNSSSTASTGLTVNDRPMAMPASHPIGPAVEQPPEEQHLARAGCSR